MSEGPTVASSGPGIVVVQVRGWGALGIRDSECPHYSKTCTSGFDKYLLILRQSYHGKKTGLIIA